MKISIKWYNIIKPVKISINIKLFTHASKIINWKGCLCASLFYILLLFVKWSVSAKSPQPTLSWIWIPHECIFFWCSILGGVPLYPRPLGCIFSLIFNKCSLIFLIKKSNLISCSCFSLYGIWYALLNANLERWKNWRKCYKDDDNYWSCSQHSGAS